MDENTFLKAQNLKNQISKLENIIKDITKRNDSKICVSWVENKYIPYTATNASNYTPDCIDSTYNKINPFPADIQDKVVQLINDELDKLKEEFNNL